MAEVLRERIQQLVSPDNKTARVLLAMVVGMVDCHKLPIARIPFMEMAVVVPQLLALQFIFMQVAAAARQKMVMAARQGWLDLVHLQAKAVQMSQAAKVEIPLDQMTPHPQEALGVVAMEFAVAAQVAPVTTVAAQVAPEAVAVVVRVRWRARPTAR